MRMRSLVVMLVALLAVAGLSAQAKPDFSGVWTMVPDKSDFGQMPTPSKMTRTITHKDPAFKIVTVQTSDATGDTTIETNFSTDGKPQTNTINGSPMKTVGSWDGTTVVFKSTLSMEANNIAIEDHYTLSDAGKTLTVARTFSTPEGTATAKIVLVKK